MKAILKYPGAKNRIADWICSYIPPHDVYVEVFAGSLAVLLNKERSHIETVNDIDGDIVNFFRVLRDFPEELSRAILLTPFSRDEYKAAFERSYDQVERARRYCVRCWQGFGNSQLYNNGFKSGQQRKSPNPAAAWMGLPEVMMQAAMRLRGVQIENLTALEIIKRYDTPDVFLYLDPPYLPGTRKGHLYKYEMLETEHKELLKAVISHPGKIMISGYDNDLYNNMLVGWRKESIKTQAEGGLKRTETLWMNYRDSQMSIFDIPEVLPDV
ncbi:DNA adenine methylase [Blautia producta]|uniref:DNA adenine methylase n=2 Tax=Blautia producta TaxID=33035 RepID=A0A7G5N1E0_9FIRM|nr:DNA adenine methylase [Blautia producta]QIB56546.1 DNA adenine methylase [Blautia producta ATCC 27340 = DSM 2950]QMW80683.1 DNA adenine methylase [Blautia producta]